MTSIVALDQAVTIAANSLHSEYFDHLFPIITRTTTWLPTLIVLLYVIIRTWGKRSLAIIVLLALAIVLADQVSSALIKPLVCRLRPTHDPDTAPFIHIVNNYRGGLYGFVSSHAANSFAVATLTSLLLRNRYYTIAITLWAAITSYSRIYLGVHFVGDILCGAALGIGIALVLYYLNYFFYKKYYNTKYTTHTTTSHNRLLTLTLVANVAIVAIVAIFY